MDTARSTTCPRHFLISFRKKYHAAKAFARAQYELDGKPVDEEFYGFMGELVSIPSRDPRMPGGEYHRTMSLVHSFGASNGKLESMRPLLGFIATSMQLNPGWLERRAQINKMQMDYYNRQMAAGYASIEAARRMSAETTARNDQFLQHIDAGLAAQNAQRSAPSSYSSSADGEFSKRADSFDQNLHGTEHMQDQYGAVSDQYNNYNYHWTDGFGNYAHSNDPNYDPNRYLNGNYQQMTPTNP